MTDVDHAFVNYETPDQRPLRQVTPERLRSLLEADEFGDGSMRPKVEACLRFVDRGGDRAVITSAANLTAALAGDAGTQVSAATPS